VTKLWGEQLESDSQDGLGRNLFFTQMRPNWLWGPPCPILRLPPRQIVAGAWNWPAIFI